MPVHHYYCRSCGHGFEMTVRTQPGPSLHDCPGCGLFTAVRQPLRMETLRLAKAAMLPDCCAVQLLPGTGRVQE